MAEAKSRGHLLAGKRVSGQIKAGEKVEPEQRIDELEGRIERVEDVVEIHGERLDGHDRNYSELRKQTEKLGESQIRLQTYMEVGFKRSEEQNNSISDAIRRLSERQDERHEQMIALINQGDRQNAQEAQEGDRRNFEAMNNRKWDARSIWITVAACVVIGIPGVVGLWRLVFG